MMQRLGQATRAWNTYWFSDGSGLGPAIFRIALGLALEVYHVPRLWYIPQLYTTAGYLSPSWRFQALHLPIPTWPVAIGLNALLHLALLALILGYRARMSCAVVFLLHTYLSWLECFSTQGAGAMLMVYSLLLLFAPAGERLSLDALRRRGAGHARGSRNQPPMVPVTMQRIMLWQLSSIYFFNVLLKLKYGGSGWLQGTHLLNLYRDPEWYARPWIAAHVEALRPVSPMLGLIMLVGLPFVAIGLLIPRLRPYAVAFGLTYHLVTICTTTIPYALDVVMWTLYLTAVEPATWERWWSRMRRSAGVPVTQDIIPRG